MLIAAILAITAAGIFFLSGPVSRWLDMEPETQSPEPTQ